MLQDKVTFLVNHTNKNIYKDNTYQRVTISIVLCREVLNETIFTFT